MTIPCNGLPRYSNRGACAQPDALSPRHWDRCTGNVATDCRNWHLPLVGVAIRFVINQGLVVIVVARASVLLLRWLLKRLDRLRSLAAMGRLHPVASLSPIDTLSTLVVRMGRASAHRYASSRWSRCEIVGRGHTHRSPLVLDNFALSSTEASNRV